MKRSAERSPDFLEALDNPISSDILSIMNTTVKIEIDVQTAELLKARAAARGMSLADWLADVAGDDNALSADLQALRDTADGPWSPDVLAEDARRLTEFRRTRQDVPWDGVKAWMQSWGTAQELPPPARVSFEFYRFISRAC